MREKDLVKYIKSIDDILIFIDRVVTEIQLRPTYDLDVSGFKHFQQKRMEKITFLSWLVSMCDLSWPDLL